MFQQLKICCGTGRRPRASDAETQDKIPQKAPAEWVEGLVQQMGDARDLGEARVRAANELRSFEQAVMQTTNKVHPLSALLHHTSHETSRKLCQICMSNILQAEVLKHV